MKFSIKDLFSKYDQIRSAQKMNFSIKDFFSNCDGFGRIYWRNPSW